MIKAAYEEIREAAAEMDYDRIEGVFEEMKDYSMPEDEKDKWNEKCGNGCDGDRNFVCVHK